MLKNSFLKLLIFLLIITQLSLFSSSTVSKTNILVLQDFYHLTRTKEFNLGLEDAQKKYNHLIFYMEHMHKRFESGQISEEDWKNYLQKKYSKIKINAIISASPDSSIFIEKYEKLFGNIPIVIINQSTTSFSNPVISFKSNIKKAIDKTVQLALEQNPSTKKAILITNKKGNVLFQLNNLLKKRNIAFEVLNVDSEESILKKISTLNRDTIVFYEPIFEDKYNNKIIPKELIASLAKHSKSPIYTFWSPLVNTGVIGGHVSDTRTLS